MKTIKEEQDIIKKRQQDSECTDSDQSEGEVIGVTAEQAAQSFVSES